MINFVHEKEKVEDCADWHDYSLHNPIVRLLFPGLEEMAVFQRHA